MPIASGIKFRCYPTREQASILAQWIGCQRFIYNAKVSEHRYFRTFSQKALSLCGSEVPEDQTYSQFKDRELTPFLYDVPPQILRNGATRFMGALIRHKKGLSERPAYKKKYLSQSVWITSELFTFGSGTGDDGCKTPGNHRLTLGNGKYAVGNLKFKAHREYGIPNTITVSQQAGKWFVSFSYDAPGTPPERHELISHFMSMDKDEIDRVTAGLDRGVSIPLAGSGGEAFDFRTCEKERLEKKDKRKRRYQRRMARQVKGSVRRKRTAARVAKYSLYAGNVRRNFAHQTSRKLADSDYQVFVFEDLKVKNLTKRPEPKTDGAGSYARNGARAKAVLNRAILDSSWGKVKEYLTYKAERSWKLVITVPPHHTSQECSMCSHTHPDNRTSQAVFECQNCGYTANADTNAAMVIKKRGRAMLRAGEIAVSARKRTMRLRKKEVLGREPAEVTHGEKDISHAAGNLSMRPSTIRETPTTIEVAI